jgi:hypothetical protein
MRLADDQEMPVEVSLGAAQTPNGPIAIALLRDIRLRRRPKLALRKALDDTWEAERAKSRFPAIIFAQSALTYVPQLQLILGTPPVAFLAIIKIEKQIRRGLTGPRRQA